MKRRSFPTPECPSCSADAKNIYPYLVPRICKRGATRDARMRRKVVRDGFYFREKRKIKVQRYLCRDCGFSFSDGTISLEYKQRRRDINISIFKQLVSLTSIRRTALLLDVDQKTVERRFSYFEKISDRHQDLNVLSCFKTEEINFDDMESSIHTKLKPVSIPMAVAKPSRIIISLEVASMPCKGPNAVTSLRKYGKRPDERKRAWDEVLSTVRKVTNDGLIITSDSHKSYPGAIKKNLPYASHIRTLSRKATIAGQGEMKVGGFDPLFSFNHTAAMCRANINRLIRRTWCTSKRPDRLLQHLKMYRLWHNEGLLAKAQNRRPYFGIGCLIIRT